MVIVKMPVDEKFEESLQTLDDEFQEIKARLSLVRKNGRDTFTAEQLCLDFAPKLKMAKATGDPKDRQVLRQLLNEIAKELDESESGSLFSQSLEIIKDAYEYIRQGNLAEATQLYNKVLSLYKEIPQEHKRIIYQACMELRKRLESAQKENGN